MTFVALQKEDLLEKMLEKEELEKEKSEEQLLETKLELEKKKENCLKATIKQKELEDQINLSKTAAEDEMNEIKKQAQKQIITKRLMFKKKLAEMRKRHKRKFDELNANILTVRMEMAGNIQKSSKIGDHTKCFIPNSSTLEKVEDYCTLNFSDSAAKFQECVSPESFCYTCCDNEFGKLHTIERENCYKTRCDQKEGRVEICDNADEAKLI